VIERFSPRTVSPAAARFAKELTRAARPASPNRAKAYLFAAGRLGAFAQSVGLELCPEVVLMPSVIERCCLQAPMSAASRRTLRANLRAMRAACVPSAPVPALARTRARPPYRAQEIAAYLALADAQGTEGRRQRAGGLVCLAAGAGLVGAELKAVRGLDVTERHGAVMVCVAAGRRPRAVPVLSRYAERLLAAARFAGQGFVIGGSAAKRRNVTTPLTSALSGGADLARLDISRLRATWLCEVAQIIGLRAFMDAAGIVCSQRLGDLVSHLEAGSEADAVALLGGRR
jgi:hypothetical protein